MPPRLLEDTRQRNAELTVINSVQKGLATQVELQGIYDLVGDSQINNAMALESMSTSVGLVLGALVGGGSPA